MLTRTQIINLHHIAEVIRKLQTKHDDSLLRVEASLALRDLNNLIKKESALLLPKLERVARGETILNRNSSAAKAAAREMRFISDRAEGRV